MRSDAIVLGRKIGTFVDWDEGDVGQLSLSDFEPIDDLDIPKGHLNVYFNKGIFAIYDDAFVEIWSADIIFKIKDLPIVPVEPED